MKAPAWKQVEFWLVMYAMERFGSHILNEWTYKDWVTFYRLNFNESFDERRSK